MQARVSLHRDWGSISFGKSLPSKDISGSKGRGVIGFWQLSEVVLDFGIDDYLFVFRLGGEYKEVGLAGVRPFLMYLTPQVTRDGNRLVRGSFHSALALVDFVWDDDRGNWRYFSVHRKGSVSDDFLQASLSYLLKFAVDSIYYDPKIHEEGVDALFSFSGGDEVEIDYELAVYKGITYLRCRERVGRDVFWRYMSDDKLRGALTSTFRAYVWWIEKVGGNEYRHYLFERTVGGKGKFYYIYQDVITRQVVQLQVRRRCVDALVRERNLIPRVFIPFFNLLSLWQRDNETMKGCMVLQSL